MRVELSHVASAAWSDGERRDFAAERVYCRAQRTVWGAVYATDAGSFSPCLVGGQIAFNETQGEVMLPLSAARGSLLALRVVRTDGRQQYCLGACAVDVDKLLEAPGSVAEL